MTTLQHAQPLRSGQLWLDRLCGTMTLTIGERQGARWQVFYRNGHESALSESTIRELYTLAAEE